MPLPRVSTTHEAGLGQVLAALSKEAAASPSRPRHSSGTSSHPQTSPADRSVSADGMGKPGQAAAPESPGETCLVRAKDPRASRKHGLFPCIVHFSARHRAGAGKNDSEQSEQCLISPGTFYVHVCVRERESKSDSRRLLGNTAWLRSSSRPWVRTLPSTHVGRGHWDTAVPPVVASWQRDGARPLVPLHSGRSISRCCPRPARTCLPEGWRDASPLFHGCARGWSMPCGLTGYSPNEGPEPRAAPRAPDLRLWEPRQQQPSGAGGRNRSKSSSEHTWHGPGAEMPPWSRSEKAASCPPLSLPCISGSAQRFSFLSRFSRWRCL
nr:uncharacterized protein LOC106037757 [Anser cygnoides]XP_047935630.1 uncharacterized protein LOC106037757 [Anser cygnoides]